MTRTGWLSTVDHAFADVVRGCSVREDGGTWITAEMAAAYTELHRLGWAHSIEIWDGEELVGGLYGLLLGGVFTGESMFHRRTDASKVAMAELVVRLQEAGGAFIDVQLPTPHLESLGVLPVHRTLFLELLRECRDDDVRLATTARPVSRLPEEHRVRTAATHAMVHGDVSAG
jgi:leucyl/phenylalanyl-tRNA--protein transferase